MQRDESQVEGRQGLICDCILLISPSFPSCYHLFSSPYQYKLLHCFLSVLTYVFVLLLFFLFCTLVSVLPPIPASSPFLLFTSSYPASTFFLFLHMPSSPYCYQSSLLLSPSCSYSGPLSFPLIHVFVPHHSASCCFLVLTYAFVPLLFLVFHIVVLFLPLSRSLVLSFYPRLRTSPPCFLFLSSFLCLRPLYDSSSFLFVSPFCSYPCSLQFPFTYVSIPHHHAFLFLSSSYLCLRPLVIPRLPYSCPRLAHIPVPYPFHVFVPHHPASSFFVSILYCLLSPCSFSLPLYLPYCPRKYTWIT